MWRVEGDGLAKVFIFSRVNYRSGLCHAITVIIWSVLQRYCWVVRSVLERLCLRISNQEWRIFLKILLAKLVMQLGPSVSAATVLSKYVYDRCSEPFHLGDLAMALAYTLLERFQHKTGTAIKFFTIQYFFPQHRSLHTLAVVRTLTRTKLFSGRTKLPPSMLYVPFIWEGVLVTSGHFMFRPLSCREIRETATDCANYPVHLVCHHQ